MIGYRVSARELRRRIREEAPDWLTRAESGEQPEWSRVKDVFVRIQHFKCGYCERWMPRPQRRADDDAREPCGGRRDYDMEHFRPRRRVTRWPAATSGLLSGRRTAWDRRRRCLSARSVRATVPRQSRRHSRHLTRGADHLPRLPGGTARFPRPQAQARDDHHRSLRPQLARRPDSPALLPLRAKCYEAARNRSEHLLG